MSTEEEWEGPPPPRVTGPVKVPSDPYREAWSEILRQLIVADLRTAVDWLVKLQETPLVEAGSQTQLEVSLVVEDVRAGLVRLQQLMADGELP